MKAILILSALLLAGCASPYPNVPPHVVAQCEYEAEVATPGSSSIIADAMRQVSLTRRCIALKGY